MAAGAGSLGAARELSTAFKAAVERGSGDFAEARALLARLKLALTQLPSLFPSTARAATSKDELAVARDAYETACLLSVKVQDGAGLERHFALLRPFYHDLRAELPESSVRAHVVGLFLTFLLVENKVEEFHCELEFLSDEDRASPFIAFPIRLRDLIMEGGYNKVLKARDATPSPLYAAFVERIVGTVRDDIADCMGASYESIDAAAAAGMLLLPSADALRAYVAEKKSDWTLADGRVHFHLTGRARHEIPAERVVASTIHYATELERIV